MPGLSVTGNAALYLRARGAPRLLGGLLVLEAVTLLSHNTPLRLPSVTGVSAPVSVAVVVPVPFALWASTGLHSTMQDLEHTAARRLRYYDLAQAAALCAIITGLLAITMAATSTAAMTAIAVRNTCLWFGAALISARILGSHKAWYMPLAGVLSILAFGWDNAAYPHAWAVPLSPAPHIPSLTAAFAALTTGLALTALPHRLRT
ncbi:hypothetical protein [Streptomyces hydrogenans]|uniref:Integral membrane protein n=1 Tax=Streptomyces hydrogenans TaxID=1873719 RepID=A0ABQ3PQD7_9ACTN|nr:hypothetical protein [Streptomyces hydrogenans]GHE25487.1 hypothetical protein GCM10018784_74160 [Streptomyces hydrogenans]GHI27239.1 hypothetical protein Shyd_86100 [Streptomyces hydrogenans]